jgi:biofilm protein TabA
MDLRIKSKVDYLWMSFTEIIFTSKYSIMPYRFLTRGYLLLACICFSLTGFPQGSPAKPLTKAQAVQWVKTGDWRQGLDKKVHPSVNALLFAEQYNKNKAIWDKAFVFLNRKDLDTLSPGMYPIDGKLLYATVGQSVSKDMDKTKWESHRKYIDLQYMIRGKEKIGVAPVAGATVTEPYDESKDIAHYETTGKWYVAEPGIFFLFFPTDAHRPDLKVDTNDPYKKLVIKISVAE